MNKLFKGDLLIFTSKGFIRTDELKKGDLILSLNSNGIIKFEEIEEINKIFKKKYNLNKIEGYYLNDNIEIFSIKNIPLNIELNEMKQYIKDYKTHCIGLTKLGILSTFDYIGFPIKKYEENIDRNPNLELKEIGKNLNKDKKITINELFNLSNSDLNDIHTGLLENNNEFNIDINDKETIYFIKYTCLLLGISINTNYKDGKINIKIYKKINENVNYNFIHNNFIWNKIKSIKKKSNYTGNLFNIKLKSNNPYLTAIGFIS